MSTILSGFHYDLGGREIYEDRVDAQQFVTAGGLQLAVAVVADGVGGENKGERAAQLAKDAVLRYLRGSHETDLPTILSNAVQIANREVHRVNEETDGASTTLAVAVIHDSKTLFVANVGDSRVYLCRNQKLTQLTIDHSFANVVPWQGKMSVEAARENPRAHVLMRALGPKPEIPIDLGFYVGTTDPQIANERGWQGLPLKDGDSILVCSDGLIKDSPSGQPYVTDEEIIRVLNSQEGEKAARSLVSFALGRNANDNVSAAVLQMPDTERHRIAQRPLRRAYAAIIGLAILLLAAAFFTIRIIQQNQQDQVIAEATQTAAALTAAELAGEIGVLELQAQNATLTAIAISSFTPTPTNTPLPTATPTTTPTPAPTPIPGQIGIYFVQAGPTPFTLNDTLPVLDEFVEFQVDNTNGTAESASLYARPNTELEFENVDGTNLRVALFLFQGGDIFIETGGYINGVQVKVGELPNVSFSVTGSCMSVEYATPPQITISCYEGVCRYATTVRDPGIEVAAGQSLVFDLQTLTASPPQTIPTAREISYRQLLEQAGSGEEDADKCDLSRPITPSPTPTPSATPTMGSTPTPSATPNAPTSGGTTAVPTTTNTPLPQPPTATNTPLPPPPTTTNTPLPPPPTTTNTPLPPPTATNTPLPPPTVTPRPSFTPRPTDTPMPTNTPVPTDTPMPTETPTPCLQEPCGP